MAIINSKLLVYQRVTTNCAVIFTSFELIQVQQ